MQQKLNQTMAPLSGALENATIEISEESMRKRPSQRLQAKLDVDKPHLTPPTPDDPRAKRVTALAEITRAITASLDVATNFAVIAQQAQHILAHDALAVLLPYTEPDTEGASACVIAFCYPPVVEPGLVLPLTDCSFSPALLTDQPIVIEDFAANTGQYAGDRLILNKVGRARPFHARGGW